MRNSVHCSWDVLPQTHCRYNVLPFSLTCCCHRYWDDDVGRLLNDPLHRVCVVTRSEELHETHGSIPGAGPSTVCYPIHMATLSNSDDSDDWYLLVADSNNDRVKLLGSRLQYVADVVRTSDGLCGPYRLSVDATQTLLAVGCVDGRVFVYRLHRSPLPHSADISSHAQNQCAYSAIDIN